MILTLVMLQHSGTFVSLIRSKTKNFNTMKTKQLFYLLAIWTAMLLSGSAKACTASFNASPDSAGTVYFQNTSTGAFTYAQWSFGDGSSGFGIDANHTYTSNGSYLVCLTVFDSAGPCQSTICDTVLVTGASGSSCSAGFSFSAVGNSGYFYPYSNSGNIASYFWSFGDGSSSTQAYPVHAYSGAGLYSVCMTAVFANGCVDTVCSTIAISNATCQASFNIYNTGGNSYVFQNTSNLDSTLSTSSCYWTFGDGGTSTMWNPSNTYNAPGYYSVCLTVIDSAAGCSSTYCDSIYISGGGSTCNAYIGYQNSNLTTNLSGYSNSGTITYYFWTFGDGSTANGQFQTHTYASAGTYNVCLTAVFAGGCVDTVCTSITVTGGLPGCQSYFTYSFPNASTANFWNQSNLDSTLITTMSYWTFGDGSYSYDWNPSHTYVNPGYYVVCLSVFDSIAGCSDIYCDSIYIQGNGGCNANFTPYDSSGTYYFLPDNGNAASYSWTFGDGGTSTSVYPMHQYTSPGTYTVCLTVAMNGQTCTSCQVVVIGSTPNCNANYFVIVDSTNANQLYFFNQSTGGNSYYWYFGDGSTSTSANPTHTYANSGTYLVCLTIYSNSSNCQDSYCDTLIIGNGQSGCVPQFYSYPDSTAGSGVMNFGLFNPCGGYQYVWTITNGTNSYTASGSNPIIAFADSGWHSVCVDAYDSTGAVISYCDSVWVYRVGSVGINENQNTISTNVFPNPANEQVTINYTLKNTQNVSVVVMSMNGQIIYNSEEQRGAGLQKLVLNTAEWPSGLYLINLRAAEGQNATRISIQH